MKVDIVSLVFCISLMLFLYGYFLRRKDVIYKKKRIQVVGSLVAIVVEGCAIWRAIIHVPPYPESNVYSNPPSVVFLFIWLAIAVASGICLLFYLKAFSNIITPWSKSSKTA
ncbi:MAG: hypothetical protein ACETVN_01980 [Asgard group archaeon]